MTRFNLTQVSTNRLTTKFHVVDSTNSVIGSVNVPTRKAADFLQHWAGPTDMPKQSAGQQQEQVASKLLRPKKMSAAIRKAMVLRGC